MCGQIIGFIYIFLKSVSGREKMAVEKLSSLFKKSNAESGLRLSVTTSAKHNPYLVGGELLVLGLLSSSLFVRGSWEPLPQRSPSEKHKPSRW